MHARGGYSAVARLYGLYWNPSRRPCRAAREDGGARPEGVAVDAVVTDDQRMPRRVLVFMV